MTGENSITGRKICFLGKGGAGKSTVLVLTARALRKHGYRVCILDADSTNLGMHMALGLNVAPAPLMEYFGGMVFAGGRITCPVDDPSLIVGATIELGELPSKYRSVGKDGITLLQGGKLADFGVGAGCDGPIVKLARDLRVTDGGKPVVLLVDFKAGLEDFSRGVMVSMDSLVVVCDPSLAGIQTAITLDRVLSQQRAGELPATEHLDRLDLVELVRQLYRETRIEHPHVVLNKVPDAESEALMRQQLEGAGIRIDAVIRDSLELRKAWLRGRPLPESPPPDPLDRLVENLEAETSLIQGSPS